MFVWMKEFIHGRYYVVEDFLDDVVCGPWLKQYAAAYTGPVATAELAGHSIVRLGSNSEHLLLDHMDGCWLSWISGLRIYVFDSKERMEHYLEDHSGQPLAPLDQPRENVLFTLGTYADASCLMVIPGTQPLEVLIDRAQEVAASLGFEWLRMR